MYIRNNKGKLVFVDMSKIKAIKNYIVIFGKLNTILI